MYVIKNNAPYVIKNKNNRTSSFSLRYQEQEQCLLRHHKQCLLHPQEQCFFSCQQEQELSLRHHKNAAYVIKKNAIYVINYKNNGSRKHTAMTQRVGDTREDTVSNCVCERS